MRKVGPVSLKEAPGGCPFRACAVCAYAGVVGQGVEANIPRPGTVDFPNPSAQLMEKVPIARVTVDGDVTAQSIPDAPGSTQPRN